MAISELRESLQRGMVIPAHPLALTAARKLDERRQRALSRYYIAAGAGGLAVGVHTTQFAIRDPKIALLKPVLELAREEMDRADERRHKPLVRIAGICGQTEQALAEARIVADRGYHIALLSLSAMRDATDDQLIAHCRDVAEVLPIMGFYLQPAVGGRALSYRFWRRFVEIENVVAIKIAPFDRYKTLDVMRAIWDSARTDVALYTGNDDNILLDLLTPYRFEATTRREPLRMLGGLLGHWAVWTRSAVEQLAAIRTHHFPDPSLISQQMLTLASQITDSNTAFLDSANAFAGCIAGIHEVLRRQGLLEGIWCLDERETLSPGQSEEIDRVYRSYPLLNDDDFVAAHRDEWLR